MIRGLAKETPPSGHSRPPILHTAYRAERERMESRDQVLAVESGRRPRRLTRAFMSASGRSVRVISNHECSHKSGGNHASIHKMQPSEQF
jgi:hypothetical protein